MSGKKKLLLILSAILLLYLLFPLWPLRIIDPTGAVDTVIPRQHILRIVRTMSWSVPGVTCLAVYVVPLADGGYMLYYRQLIPAFDRAVGYTPTGDAPGYHTFYLQPFEVRANKFW